RTLDLAAKLALAAGAVAGLAARLDLAGFGQIAAQRVDVLVVKALATGAVNLPTATAHPHVAPAGAVVTVVAVTALAALARTFFVTAVAGGLVLAVTHCWFLQCV